MSTVEPTSSQIPVLDADDVRRTILTHGRALVDRVVSQGTGYRAEQRAGAHQRRHPAESSGLRFAAEPWADRAWSIYAYPVPVVGVGQVWDHELIDALIDRLRASDTPVWVRTYRTLSAATSVAHRDNATLADRYPEVSKVLFRARTVGTGEHRTYAEVAEVAE